MLNNIFLPLPTPSGPIEVPNLSIAFFKSSSLNETSVFPPVILYAAFLSEDGKIGPIEVPKDIVKYLLFLINFVNGGVGIINAIGILKFRQQSFLRYHSVALSIVEQAYQNGLIDHSKKEQMFDAIALYLTPCDDPANRKRCEEELRRLTVKLADIAVK